MSKIRAIALLATGLAVLPAALGHADDIALNIASGLWEITATPTMTVPSPRAVIICHGMEASKELVASSGLYDDPKLTAYVSETGQKTVLANSPMELQTREQCSDAKGVRQLDVHMQAPMPQTLAGTVNMVVTKNGKTITIHNDLQGKWVAADCAGVDAPSP